VLWGGVVEGGKKDEVGGLRGEGEVLGSGRDN